MAVATQAVADSEEFRGIVRIMGKDLKGQLPLRDALHRVRGIGNSLANALAIQVQKEFGISPSARVGDLTDRQLAQVEEVVRDPPKYGIPSFMLNRQHDDETGSRGRHVVQSDLQIATHQDVEREKSTRTWIGWRHSIGQRVRGQHSRTTGRTGMTVGVLKKAIKAQKEAAARGAQDKAPAAAGKKEEKK